MGRASLAQLPNSVPAGLRCQRLLRGEGQGLLVHLAVCKHQAALSSCAKGEETLELKEQLSQLQEIAPGAEAVLPDWTDVSRSCGQHTGACASSCAKYGFSPGVPRPLFF